MRDPVQFSPVKLFGIAALCTLVLNMPGSWAASKKAESENEPKQTKSIPSFLAPPKTNKKAVLESILAPKKNITDNEADSAASSAPEEPDDSVASSSPPADDLDTASISSSSTHVLEGKTQMTHIVLEDQKLYQVAMKAMENQEYSEAIRYLQMMHPKLGKGNEPYLAQCIFYEAGCHKKLKRMNAAMDEYNKAYELFAKYDKSNPLKGQAWKEYETLRAMKGRMDSRMLEANVNSTSLQARAKKQYFALVPQKGQLAINPNVTLATRANNTNVLLRCNDHKILPKIVKECFSKMSCLETAEIGSNVTNAVSRWMPLKVSGQTAAFAVSGYANPAFKVKVSGHTYLIDLDLPFKRQGKRTILVVTNGQKICAVDVDTYDTWLLRIKKTKSGVLTAAHWHKLSHKKNVSRATIKRVPDRNMRKW